MMASIIKTFQLKPYNLEIPDNVQSTSFRQQIKHNSSTVSGLQRTQFNLGNTILYHNPMDAAEALIKREYQDLFQDKLQQAIFIPPVFDSKQYRKDVPELTRDMTDNIYRVLRYLEEKHQGHWLTSQLRNFMDNNSTCIEREYDRWKDKIKLIYLINSKGGEFSPNWNQCKNGINKFANECIKYIEGNLHVHVFLKEFEQATKIKKVKEWLNQNFAKNFYRSLEEEKEESPDIEVTLEFLLGLKWNEIDGEEPEHYLFEILQQMETKQLLSDFVILRGLDIYTVPGRTNVSKEYDFLLLSAKRKLIVAIECKNSSSKLKAAKDQLKASKELFENHLGDCLDKEWVFYPVVFTCDEHAHDPKHVINAKTDVKEWLEELLLEFNKTQFGESLEESMVQLKEIVKTLVFCLYRSPGPVTTSNWICYLQKTIESISRTKTIMFYTKQQMEVLCCNKKRLVIDGGFGTGKSILLIEKAQMLARQKQEKVHFILGSGSVKQKSLLHLKLDAMWKNEENISIKKITKTKDILEFLEGTYEHVFIDEMKLNEGEASEINEVWNNKNKYLWIVSHRSSARETLQVGFSVAQLDICLRNSKEVQETVKSYVPAADHPRNIKSILPNIPSAGMKPKVADTAFEAIDMAINCGFLRSTNLATTSIGIVYYIVVKTLSNRADWFRLFLPEIMTILYDKRLDVRIYSRRQTWKAHDETRPLLINDPEECFQHLDRSNSLLIVDNVDVTEGFEWPVVIYDARAMEGEGRETCKANDFLRAMVLFIAILNPQEKKIFEEII